MPLWTLLSSSQWIGPSKLAVRELLLSIPMLVWMSSILETCASNILLNCLLVWMICLWKFGCLVLNELIISQNAPFTVKPWSNCAELSIGQASKALSSTSMLSSPWNTSSLPNNSQQKDQVVQHRVPVLFPETTRNSPLYYAKRILHPSRLCIPMAFQYTWQIP